jgi:hypothetical protein
MTRIARWGCVQFLGWASKPKSSRDDVGAKSRVEISGRPHQVCWGSSALLENPPFSYVIVATRRESVSISVHKDAFWHALDNISKCHDIRHSYIVSSLIDILFEHATEIISKRHEVRHDLMCHYCQDTLQYVSNNVYSHIKILFDMIVKNVSKWCMVRHDLNHE